MGNSFPISPLQSKSICFVMTNCFVLNAFVVPIINKLVSQGWEVKVLVNLKSGSPSSTIPDSVEITHLNISRNISIINDLSTLYQMYQYFSQNRPLYVHSVTPKAGLLAMLAAWISGVSNRIHTFTGQVWSTKKGMSRLILKSLDKILVMASTYLLADSRSQLAFLVSEGVADKNKIHLIGQGSICGIDIDKFKKNDSERKAVRARLDIPHDGIVFLFVGRLNNEKGVKELAQAYSLLHQQIPNAFLIFVGPDEGNQIDVIRECTGTAMKDIRIIGETPFPSVFYSVADIFCLPSHREGFGQVLIEAAACELPVIATKIYGIIDAVADGETGVLVPVGDVAKLASAMLLLAKDEGLRIKMGQAGYMRVQKQFLQTDVISQWADIYRYEYSASSKCVEVNRKQ